jgi:hypothetical protein
VRRIASLQLKAIARGDRAAATTRIRDAFGEAGVWIVSVNFFGGVQTVFCFEGSASSARELAGALARASIELDDASRGLLALLPAGEEDTAGTLAVLFPQGDPDLRRDVPSVPG